MSSDARPARDAPIPAREGEPLPSTEGVDAASQGIDAMATLDVLRTIHAADARVHDAVGRVLEVLAPVVDAVVEAFASGGRLIYFGAGTSGRLGVLDASECPPTFSVSPGLVVARIAGGDEALRRAVEGAEDDPELGRADVAELAVGARDVVCGIAASGTTPYVHGALAAGRERGATTILIHCNASLSPARIALVDHAICLDVGAEVLAGSTRMKCGTATKLALNLLTTSAMIRSGRVFENRMVDVVPSNEKLLRRARGLVAEIGGVGDEDAERILDAAGGRTKLAILMARSGLDATSAAERLERAGGFLRRAVDG